MIATGLVEVYLDGAWVDVTDRVDDAMQDLSSAHGRQTVLVDPDPSVMTLVLRNDDHELTPGNASSSYYPFFDAGAPIRWTEVLDATTVNHFNGTMQMPQVATMWDEGDEEAGEPPRAHEVVAVSCVDILARLDGGRAFVSTLTAHVRNAGGSDLVYYAPCVDPGLPLADLVSGRTTKGVGTVVPTPAAVDGPSGEDGSFVRLYPDLTQSGYFSADGFGLTVASGQTLVLSAWFRSEVPPDSLIDAATGRFLAALSNASQTDLLAIEEDGVPTGLVCFGGSTSGYGTPSTGRRLERDAWRLVTARLTLPTGVVDLWTGSDMVASAVMSSIPASMSITQVDFGGSTYWGAVGHVQVYLGPAGTFPYAQHLAQYQAGLLGFERQTVSDRIEMVAGFAGVDPANIDIEASSTQMQVCRLAGVTPGAELRNAATTDQGLLFSSPAGRVIFQSRKHRYYGADTPVEIPYEWLGAPLLWRRDRPLNAAAVTQNGGAIAYGTDEASIDQYGQGPFTPTLDTAIAVDAAALAAFIVEFFSSPRSRIESMTFALDFFTEAQQLLLTTIAIGQRISITDAPGHWPEGGPQASVEGRQMQSSNGVRTLALKCAPIVGSVPGTPGPWFTLGASELGGPDIVPF